MNKDDKKTLIERILKEYQKVFLEIGILEVEKNGIRYGTPPKSMIVKYHDKFDIHRFHIGNILSVWRIYHDRIENLTNLDTKPIKDPYDGMYFHEGIGHFSMNDKCNEIQLDWSVGPRFGRAHVYKIVFNDEGNVDIIRDKLIWVS